MNQIRQIREGTGISQVELYRLLGWKQSRIANYEAGLRTPSLRHAREIVSALTKLGAICTLESAFPDSPAASDAPILKQTIHAAAQIHQTDESAVRPSSDQQACP